MPPMGAQMTSGYVVLAVLCGAALLSALSAQISALQQKISALSRLEAKVDLLLKNAGITYDPSAGLPPGVIDALEAGNKIEAIKRYRQATGRGLKEAKDFIEELQRQKRTAG
jgi:ribosomal protein L7/L12